MIHRDLEWFHYRCNSVPTQGERSLILIKWELQNNFHEDLNGITFTGAILGSA